MMFVVVCVVCGVSISICINKKYQRYIKCNIDKTKIHNITHSYANSTLQKFIVGVLKNIICIAL